MYKGYRIQGCSEKGVKGVHDKFIGQGVQSTGYKEQDTGGTEYMTQST